MPTRVVRWFRALMAPYRRSIQLKLILTMIVLSVLPVIAVTVLAAEKSRASMETEVVETNMSNMKWTGIYISDQLDRLNQLIYSIQISPDLSDYLNEREPGNLSSQFNAQRKMLNTLANVYYSAGSHVIGIQLYLKQSQSLFTFNGMQNDITTVNGIPPQYAEMWQANKDYLIRTSPTDAERFTLIRSIRRFEDQKQTGAISLDVLWSQFDQTLGLLGRGDQHQVLITDTDGRIMYPVQARQSPPPAGVLTALRDVRPGPGMIQTAGHYVFYNDLGVVGLRLVKIIPTSSINHSAFSTMLYGIIVGVISILVSICIAVFIAWRTARPIVHLARSVQELDMIKGAAGKPSTRPDEIGLLERSLHGMAGRIREHIQTEYSINLQKKTAELKALQAQIHPHFLQNTLQMIGSMVFSQKPEDTYEVIRSLSEMFRYVVREPQDMASLRAELDHAGHYMRIQQRRFPQRLVFRVETDERAMDIRLPKLSLQPLLENAFQHGLDRKAGAWRMEIRVEIMKEDVWITVCDNGNGMAPDKLEKVRAKLENASEEPIWAQGSHIGLSNVASRLRMNFGMNYGVTIDSEQGVGTRVTIRIPFTSAEEGDI
ncbi:sensor histidine kinase [Paenibacillus sp. Aloe-11]|uniref:sensor histidine kinase n=1 Tax=Paenibacillus sp. Aloe-11 TaxID=1050222 RepID=UPI00024F0216|nr:sensor histidine kinase [Paenibacillus sp. Aloe-11]EHS59203.1 putative sensor with HAMP domain-containing protein [Paenibacillus sp. Aloe-11]